MPHTEWFIPRPVLFNAALYSVSALIYTLTLFALEVIRPGKYVFDPITAWRKRFSNLAICSWPILLFGGLILVAVRIGSRSRTRRAKREKDKKKKNKKKKKKPTNRVQPPSTAPPPATRAEPTFPLPPSLPLPPKPSRHGLPTRTKSSRSKRSGKRPVPRGYVSVTRLQRIFASFGFLWVAMGLACTSACGALVFVGQRERYKLNATALGGDDGWKSWVIPLITGGLPLVVYAIMAVSTFVKCYTTLTAKARQVDTPATSVEDNEDPDLAQDVLDLDVMFETPEGYPVAYPVAPPPAAVGRRELVEMQGRAGVGERRGFGYRPDEQTVERMMRQLRDMGFKNVHQNIAALEAASFDLDVASDKLFNAQV